ncbi:hypothetical protein HCZ30_15605 [Marivivens donghaensis]|uniref:DUF3311 domain-containing protein n=1 Tax=Marivivens donghaensis TaxID=1699413 RepID=A0ABX0W0Y4_9RHOB|nr:MULTISPECIES: hypothetical protein [Marivivens]NIY73856.1 hypothetical protein [Marivivens donghaensis]
MAAPKKLTFLERSSYRRRRIRDVMRVMPIAGLLLMFLPLLWPKGEGSGYFTSAALIYLFVLWVALIVIAGVLARYLGIEPDSLPQQDKR